MNDLNKLKLIDEIYFKFIGTIGKQHKSDFRDIPSVNIMKGFMYVITDNGLYTAFSKNKEEDEPLPKKVFFHSGDILIALKSSEFLIYEENNWLCINTKNNKDK